LLLPSFVITQIATVINLTAFSFTNTTRLSKIQQFQSWSGGFDFWYSITGIPQGQGW